MSTQMGLSLVSDGDRASAENQIRDLQRDVRFDVRDFPIEFILDRFRREELYIPEYQREFIWKQHHKCAFVESVILGLPIPLMFLAEIDDGRQEIVDGAQRIQTLEEFASGDLVLTKLDKLTSLNGFSFNDLPISQQRKFTSRPLRIVMLEEATTPELRYEIFRRINTTGEKARSSEVRRGAYAGPFMKFVEACAKNPSFLQLCPITPALRDRREGEELILRFFAYSDEYKKFRHDVEKFLDSFVRQHLKSFDKDRYEKEFTRMLEFVGRHFPHGFAKEPSSKTTPRVRFEAISVGVNLALREKPDLKPADTSWLDSAEFTKHTTTHASNSLPRLKGRIEFVKNSLLGK
jgi:hypothetical protein